MNEKLCANCRYVNGSLCTVSDCRNKSRWEPKENEHINHPQYYGGADNPYETIKVIEAWGLGFCLGNTVKYIGRARKKHPDKELEDLKKAAWYLNREIKNKEIQRREPCE